jgi:hypothetical protein
MKCSTCLRCPLLSVWLLIVGSAALAAKESEREFLGRTSEQWLARLQSQQPQEQIEAAWALAQLAPHDPQLAVKLLGSEDSTARYWGLQGLQRAVRDGSQLESVQKIAHDAVLPLLADESPAVRIAAAETLGLMGEPGRALPVLVEAMSHPQDAVRIQAVAALEKLGPAARPAEKALQDATSDSSEYVKRISTRAQQRLGTSQQ